LVKEYATVVNVGFRVLRAAGSAKIFASLTIGKFKMARPEPTPCDLEVFGEAGTDEMLLLHLFKRGVG
jgi:hypothetical protein